MFVVLESKSKHQALLCTFTPLFISSKPSLLNPNPNPNPNLSLNPNRDVVL